MHERSKGGNARNFPVDYLTAINQNHLGQNLDSPSKYGGIYFFSRYARLHTFANSRWNKKLELGSWDLQLRVPRVLT